MGFVLESFANVLIGAMDTIVLWICTLSVEFNLNIGESGSAFSTVFPSAVGSSVRGASGAVTAAIPQFAVAIGVLAVLIVLIITIFKIYVLMASPYSQSESPGEIALRFILGLTGVISAYPLFRYIQKGFNAAYQLFVKPYKAVTKFFKTKNYLALKEKEESYESLDRGAQAREQYTNASPTTSTTKNAGDSFVFGSDHLIGNPKKPGNEAIIDHPFALALIELFVGIAMMIALAKLVFEIYERYVILAVLYLFCPLAFATLVAKKGEIFKNYCWMVGSQFILMCSNLVFLGAFMAAWYNVLNKGAPSMDGKDVYFFKDSQSFVTTMLLLIGWLLVGQKMDELLRSLGLSAAQTGSGIMGAALGSMMAVRMAVGGVAAGVGTTGKALTGQTGVQRAWKAGLDGKGGGLVGKLAESTPKGKANKAGRAQAAEQAAKRDALVDKALSNMAEEGSQGGKGDSLANTPKENIGPTPSQEVKGSGVGKPGDIGQGGHAERSAESGGIYNPATAEKSPSGNHAPNEGSFSAGGTISSGGGLHGATPNKSGGISPAIDHGGSISGSNAPSSPGAGKPLNPQGGGTTVKQAMSTPQGGGNNGSTVKDVLKGEKNKG